VLQIWFASQQPFGQDAAVHTHFPCALQSWSSRHCVQRPPPAPQVLSVEPTHCPLEQQPAQVMPPQLQAPLVHACPAAHVEHAFPPVPQAFTV